MLKRFIMVKKRFTIVICFAGKQNQTFTCDIVYHKRSTFTLCELVNVFSYV